MNKLRALFFLLLGLAMLSVTVVAQDGAPKKIEGGILNGKARNLPRPEYPVEAKTAGLEGTVYVNVVIDESGTVISAVASTETHKVYRSKGEEAEKQEVPPQILCCVRRPKGLLSKRRSRPHSKRTAGESFGDDRLQLVLPKSAVVDLEKSDAGVLNGKAISLPRPAYPAAARRSK